MTTACVIAAALILIAGLFAVIVERTTERDDARAERDRLERELEAATRPRLRLVVPDPVVDDDEIPQADESWLDEITDGRWT